MSEGDRYSRRRAVRFGSVAFVMLSLLPVWPAWYFSSWEALGEPTSFWTLLASLPRAFEQCSVSELAFDYYGPHLIPPVSLQGGSLLVRRLLADRFRGGSVPLALRAGRVLALCLFVLATALLALLGRW